MAEVISDLKPQVVKKPASPTKPPVKEVTKKSA